MASRSITYLAAFGLLAGACGAPSGQEPAAQSRPDTLARLQAPSSLDALVADAEVALASGDKLSARMFLDSALKLDAGNAAVRARLAELGGPVAPPASAVIAVRPPVSTPVTAPVTVPVTVPVPSPAPAATSVASAAPGGAPVRVAAVRRVRVAARRAPRPVTLAVGGVGSTPRRSSTVTTSEGGVVETHPAESPFVFGPVVTDRAPVTATPVRNVKKKHNYPWTRAQRWLVAKGLGGGAGAGVVVGAIIGNVPGALIAGSLTGGAVGFKRATKIGPAEPYPTERETAAFDAKQQERARADSVATSDVAQAATGEQRVAESRPE